MSDRRPQKSYRVREPVLRGLVSDEEAPLVSKKVLALMLAAGLLAGAAVIPADAAKKKKKVKPVATTLFLDGESEYGEEDQLANATYLKLSPQAGGGEKSMSLPSYSIGPNNQCAGNRLYPVFVGGATGTIKGDVKVSFLAQSTPGGKVDVRIWPDVGAQACNDEYIEPAGSVQVDLPTSKGVVEAVIEDVNFRAVTGVMVQLTSVAGSVADGPTVPPFYGRAYYGTDEAKVQFSCLPPKGAKSCI